MLPAVNLANLLSLPARHFAVVDAGTQRARILVATVSRGRPRILRTHLVDAHEDGLTTEQEVRDEAKGVLGKDPPEALVVVMPQRQVLRHILDVPPADAAQTRALVEREAANIGGLSESQWVFDSVRLRPFGRLVNPLAAAFCRQDHLKALLEGIAEDENLVFDVRPAGDALAAAFREARPEVADALLVDLGASNTGVTILAGGQAVFATSFPLGSGTFTAALAQDRGGTVEAAEVLKRTEPPALVPSGSPGLHAAVMAWLTELERSVTEWREDHPELSVAAGAWPAFLAGGGALQPRLVEEVQSMSRRPLHGWPAGTEGQLPPDFATAWGALLLALGIGGASPSLLPPAQRRFWNEQRFWRGLASFNVVLAVVLAFVLVLGFRQQTRFLAAKDSWQNDANQALQDARDIRVVSEAFNARTETLRPVLERQRQTVETLQILGVLQRERTNANHWYVLLADGASYAAGSNDFPVAPPPPRGSEGRFQPVGIPATNLPPTSRTFIAEVCLVPQGEQMRQALSELVSDLKRYSLFRNVDVLPSERRHERVATNLIFPERHFALELNLSEAELLPPILLPRVAPTNREPHGGFRGPPRQDPPQYTNGIRSTRKR